MDCGSRRAAALAGVILAFLALVGTVRADELKPGLRVDYDPPQLSVEAREVELGAVLGAIGAKVGFSVVELTPASRVVTLSIRNASVDEVLRPLLRAENHTVLYRPGGGPSMKSGAIDRIVLLGAASPATAIPGEGRAPDAGQAPGGGDASPATASLWPAPVASSQSWPDSSSLLNPAPVDASDPAVSPVSVGDLLKAHAMAAAQAAQASTDQGAPAPVTSLPAPSTPPATLSAALAATTRRAQQALGALIDGLATATRSLQQSQPAGGK